LPYRVDIAGRPPDALDLLVRLGALDIEPVSDGLAAILPDGVAPDTVAYALGLDSVTVSAAIARDNGSVWLLNPGAVPIGSTALRLVDGDAFGTGRHPTTVLCIEALGENLTVERPGSILDVGTGSGILALAALTMGVPQAVGLDIDAEALQIAAQNAQLNGLADRLRLVLGGPDTVDGNWPLVVANVLAAPLIEMAPMLVRRVGRHGRLILSGIQWSLEAEVWQTYRHLGMQHISSKMQAGWTVVVGQASW
jgi:ribosomal protein L11 methylase PrmA